MTAKNLSTVANEVIESYGNTAKHVIHAYRAGGERAVGLMEASWNRALRESRSQLEAGVAKNATALQQAFCGFTIKGLSVTSNVAQEAVNQMMKLAEAGVERLAANAHLFEEKTGVTTLNTLAQAARPGAEVLCTLVTQLEKTTAGLASKIASR